MNLLQTFRAVLTAFIGIKKGKQSQQDFGTLKIQNVVIVGIVCAVLFVTVLKSIVSFIVN
jgi:hypothetical protein